MPEDEQLSKSVKREIEQGVTTYGKWWRIFDWTSVSLVLLAILLSFVAGVLAAGKFIPTGHELCSAVIAGLPALLLSVDRTFTLGARSKWFWNMLIQYQDIQRAVERGDMGFKEASRKIQEVEENGKKEFPNVVIPGCG